MKADACLNQIRIVIRRSFLQSIKCLPDKGAFNTRSKAPTQAAGTLPRPLYAKTQNRQQDPGDPTFVAFRARTPVKVKHFFRCQM